MTASAPDAPLPEVTTENRAYFAAAAQCRLEIQQCSACSKWTFPPRSSCPSCFAVGTLRWTATSGEAALASYSYVYRPQHPAYADHLPIIFAAVTLREGLSMYSVIDTSQLDAVRIGMALRVTFEQRAPGIGIPRWRPV